MPLLFTPLARSMLIFYHILELKLLRIVDDLQAMILLGMAVLLHRPYRLPIEQAWHLHHGLGKKMSV